MKRRLAGGSDRPAFVLIHGSWHGAWTWNEMTPLLAKAGYASIAIDLPGAGTRTRFPQSFLKRPLDKAAFATEKSPVAAITQGDRTKAAIDAVDHAVGLGNGKVAIVGHSWGGVTISHVAEAVPEKLHAVVYLTAFLLPNGMTAGAILGDPAFETGQVTPLLMAEPAKTGALRIDPRRERFSGFGRAQGWRRREALSARDGTCGGSGRGRFSGCPGLWPGVGRACEAPSFQAVAVTAFRAGARSIRP